MTEDDARAWISARYDVATIARLDDFANILVAESDRQNLVAPSTVGTMWSRHLLDSAQLVDFATKDWGHWVDIGSGAGLPGLVVAILSGRTITLIEPRRLRVEFLTHCATTLGLNGVRVIQSKAINADVAGHVDVISARAVGKLDSLFAQSEHFATRKTRYILPKGESAQSEVAMARRSWHGVFHVEQSIVDPKSGIVIASGVARR